VFIYGKKFSPIKGKLMKHKLTHSILFFFSILTVQCTQTDTAGKQDVPADGTENKSYGGFENQQEWGEHLVIIAGCNDCHTPKRMTNMGPVLDSSRWLSGHPAKMPQIDVNRKELESKGLVTTMDLTEWAGPWGVSFTANLTPHETGIGNWTEAQFMLALREGKYKGLATSRQLLPPMPWEMYRHMTDDELKAIFTYLKSIKPVENLVPPPLPPVAAGKG